MENIVVNYSLSKENVLEVFKTIEKEEKSGKKRNICAVILLILFILFFVLWLIKKSVFFVFAYVFFISVYLGLLILPYKNKKTLAKLISDSKDSYYMDISKENIYFNEEKTDLISLENGKYYETANVFVIDAGEEKVFCLPKSYTDPKKVRDILKNYNYKCLEENK